MEKNNKKSLILLIIGIAMIVFGFYLGFYLIIGIRVQMLLILVGGIIFISSFVFIITRGLPTNKKERLIKIGVRIILTIYALFLFNYGLCAIFITPSIDPSLITAIKAAKRTLRIIGIPYTVLGGVFFALLIFNNVLWRRKFGGNILLKYGITLTIIGSVFVISFIICSIIADEMSMMIIGFIPSFFMLLHGINSIVKYKKN